MSDVIAVPVCCGRSVIRGRTPEGAMVALDAEPVTDGPSAFVTTIDGRVVVFPEANPKYTGVRYRMHDCGAAADA